MISTIYVIVLLALALLALYFNLRLLKNEQIRKLFYITEFVKKELSYIGVKADDECIRLVYQAYLNQD